jgi:hypothetical protein
MFLAFSTMHGFENVKSNYINNIKMKYSGPSSYDRVDIRTTWVTTKKISFDLRPKS